MLRMLRSCLVLLCLGLLAAPGGSRAESPSAAEGLAGRLARALARLGLPDEAHGVAVLTRGPTPRVVYASGHTLALVPASVAKVLTTAVALDLLGPGHELRTRLFAAGPLTDGRLAGDLVLVGGADPGLNARFLDGDARAGPRAFAAAVRAAGIRRVDGALRLDESLLDDEPVHPSWSAADRARWYGAGTSALSYNDNCVDVVARGAAPGQPARLEFPAGHGPWTVDNRVRTRAGRALLGGVWPGGGTTLRLDGGVPPGATALAHVPVPDAGLYLGAEVLKALAEAGVEVAGGVLRGTVLDAPAPRRLLYEHRTPLAEALAVMNERSHNLYAALLFKRAGAALTGRGSWASGERAVAEMLARRRLGDAGRTRIVDGSGLSLDNRVTAGLLAQCLASFDQDLLRGPVLEASLPVSGQTGTLQGRLGGPGLAGRVRAKTGTLNDVRVRSLCGYAAGPPGHPGYAFAIVLNGAGASHARIDELVAEIARAR